MITGRYGDIEQISIHALREEGDAYIAVGGTMKNLFLSTPSARRATCRCWSSAFGGSISIHALREEGDLGHGPKSAMLIKFLSTPSARRATSCAVLT